MFLTAVVSNDSSLCFQTLQDLESVSIFFESEACLSSLQVNASVLWACTFFRWWWWKSGSSPPEDERHVCAPLWIHYSQFRCLLHTLLLYLPSTFPALPLSCQIPLSVAQWSHLHPETGSQWCSEDFDEQIETNRLNFCSSWIARPALNGLLVANPILIF